MWLFSAVFDAFRERSFYLKVTDISGDSYHFNEYWYQRRLGYTVKTKHLKEFVSILGVKIKQGHVF